MRRMAYGISESLLHDQTNGWESFSTALFDRSALEQAEGSIDDRLKLTLASSSLVEQLSDLHAAVKKALVELQDHNATSSLLTGPFHASVDSTSAARRRWLAARMPTGREQECSGTAWSPAERQDTAQPRRRTMMDAFDRRGA